MQKTVMFITNSGVGLYSFRYELIEKLVNLGFKLILVYPNGQRREEFEKIGCEYLDIPFDSSSTNPLADLKLYGEFKKVIHARKPDCALLYTIKPCIYAGWILKRMHIPYICTVTGVSPALICDKPYIRFISKWLSKIGYNGSSIVYFQNSMNEELFTKLKIAVGKHELISGSGVNVSKFQYVDYPEDDGTIKLLYLGRLKKIKGVDELAEALIKLNTYEKKIQCKVVGESGDELPFFNEAVKNSVIDYVGPTDDVRPYISWCDAVVLPSYGEGMSNVLQEACACGRPILASDIPGCKEIFDQDITGFGFETQNSDSLKNAIMAFSNVSYEQRKEMGVKAREKMVREFDREKVVDIYTERIKEIVNE